MYFKYFSQFPVNHNAVSERVEEFNQPAPAPVSETVNVVNPRPIVQRKPTKKHTLDDAHYEALVAEKNKFQAETDKLYEEAAMMRAKTEVLLLKRQLLEIELMNRTNSM
jgi:hypothetical protein